MHAIKSTALEPSQAWRRKKWKRASLNSSVIDPSNQLSPSEMHKHVTLNHPLGPSPKSPPSPRKKNLRENSLLACKTLRLLGSNQPGREASRRLRPTHSPSSRAAASPPKKASTACSARLNSMLKLLRMQPPLTCNSNQELHTVTALRKGPEKLMAMSHTCVKTAAPSTASNRHRSRVRRNANGVRMMNCFSRLQ